jgi:molybdopterin-guanine dinucleotide biosynthesis adapter protein
MISAFAIVGYKKTGKTTLIEKLIRELSSRGYRVGTVKHDGHEFEYDHPHTDTWRMRQAGASVVAIASRSKWVLQDFQGSPSLEDLLTHIKGVDLVLVEGWKHSVLPKIVLLHPQEDIFKNEALVNVRAIAAPNDLVHLAPPGIRRYDRDDIRGLADCIIQAIHNA